MKKYQATPVKDSDWRDLRDARGKLCARLNTKEMVLEIKRSDRGIMARFDLHEYLIELRIPPKGESQ